MKYYKFYLKQNSKLLLLCLGISLCIDLIVFASDLPYADVKGYWRPLLISLGITVFMMLLLLGLVFVKVRNDMEFLVVLDKKGPCDELIELYIKKHPRMTAMNHISLCAYLLSMNRFDDAQMHIDAAGRSVIADIRTRAYYSETLISLKLCQRQFQQAAMLFNNYSSMMNSYCSRHADALAVDHYSHAAILYAMSGNFSAAMDAVGRMDKALRKNREFAFTRNTALMTVYLIMSDFRKADELKSMMLRDVKDYNGFTFDSFRYLVLKDIDTAERLFDPRVRKP